MQSAISRPHSLALDAVRAGAALVVMVCHAAQLGLYARPWPFSKMVQHDAVVIFFVLSGLVIADSTFSRRLPAAEYAIARIARIMPVALAGIIIGNLVWLIARITELDLHQPPGFETADLHGLALSLSFMSMSPGATGPVANPPFWSLCYEVWYYALFGIATYLKGPRRLLWLFAATLAAGPRILLLMPVWLTGVILQPRLSSWQRRPALGAAAIVGGGVIVVLSSLYAAKVISVLEWLTGLDFYDVLFFSQFWLTDWLAAPGVAAILAGMAPLGLPLVQSARAHWRCGPARSRQFVHPLYHPLAYHQPPRGGRHQGKQHRRVRHLADLGRDPRHASCLRPRTQDHPRVARLSARLGARPVSVAHALTSTGTELPTIAIAMAQFCPGPCACGRNLRVTGMPTPPTFPTVIAAIGLPEADCQGFRKQRDHLNGRYVGEADSRLAEQTDRAPVLS